MPYSDYVVFVDESGDHGLVSIDSDYPVFVLDFCVFRKEDYIQRVVPKVEAFKFEHFGHDLVVLHEHGSQQPICVPIVRTNWRSHSVWSERTVFCELRVSTLSRLTWLSNGAASERTTHSNSPSGAFVMATTNRAQCLDSRLSLQTRSPTPPDCNWPT